MAALSDPQQNRSISTLCFARRIMLLCLALVGGIFSDRSLAFDAPVPASSQEKEPVVAARPPLAYYYGFRNLEPYKLEQSIQNLIAHDLNGDGRSDLAVFDNGRSRIDLLLQRAKKPDVTSPPPAEDRVNLIENDWRFEHVKIPIQQAISSLAIGDFNGDGRADLAYVAPPRELILRFQSKDSPTWVARRRIRVNELTPGGWTLDAGDLNSDGSTDLVLLGTNETYLFFQKEGQLQDPVRLFNTSGKLGLVRVIDLDGDGRNDIVYTSGESADRPLRARLQETDGAWGPEASFELPAYRALAFAELNGRPGAEVLVIENVSGRVKVYSLADKAEEDAPPTSQFLTFGFGQSSSGRNRDLSYGDLDGDGRLDVVATDPEGAQLLLYLQPSGGQFVAAKTFPCFAGVNRVRCADLDDDMRAEVVLGSTQEKTIGISRIDQGRLTFPSALPVTDDPILLELADLNADARPEIVYVSRRQQQNQRLYFLRALVRREDGQWAALNFGDQPQVPLTTLKADPEGLLVFDPNHDHRLDFLVFPSGSGQTPLLLTTSEKGEPTLAGTESIAGIGGATRSGMFVGKLDGPTVLIAQNNFARQVALGADGRWMGIDQFNATDPNAKIVGVAAVDLDRDGVPEISLVDTTGNKLHFLKRENGVYRPWKELEIGNLNYKAFHVADFNRDGAEDQLIFGAEKFGITYSGFADRQLRELASYESPLKESYLNDLVAGDLNHDSRPDLVLIDTGTQSVHLAAFNPPDRLQHALNFKVFEARSFREAPGFSDGEPREAIVADVTGDSLPDLILMAHDRILVYPQDDGAETPQAAQVPSNP